MRLKQNNGVIFLKIWVSLMHVYSQLLGTDEKTHQGKEHFAAKTLFNTLMLKPSKWDIMGIKNCINKDASCSGEPEKCQKIIYNELAKQFSNDKNHCK